MILGTYIIASDFQISHLSTQGCLGKGYYRLLLQNSNALLSLFGKDENALGPESDQYHADSELCREEQHDHYSARQTGWEYLLRV